jgi:hypothetical protein
MLFHTMLSFSRRHEKVLVVCPFNSKALGIAEAVMSEASQVVLLLGAAASCYSCMYLGLEDCSVLSKRA